jgi:hypothetical protein
MKKIFKILGFEVGQGRSFPLRNNFNIMNDKSYGNERKNSALFNNKKLFIKKIPGMNT